MTFDKKKNDPTLLYWCNSEGSVVAESGMDERGSQARPGALTMLDSPRRPGLVKQGSSRRFLSPSPLMDDRSQAFFAAQTFRRLSLSGGNWSVEVSLVDIVV